LSLADHQHQVARSDEPLPDAGDGFFWLGSDVIGADLTCR
jgi:hypothetical protein